MVSSSLRLLEQTVSELRAELSQPRRELSAEEIRQDLQRMRTQMLADLSDGLDDLDLRVARLTRGET